MTKGIYKLFTKASDKVYIGSSVNIESRFALHRAELSSNRHSLKTLQKEVNEVGIKNLIFEVIEEVKDDSELLERERYWIDFYDSLNNGHNKKRVPSRDFRMSPGYIKRYKSETQP